MAATSRLINKFGTVPSGQTCQFDTNAKAKPVAIDIAISVFVSMKVFFEGQILHPPKRKGEMGKKANETEYPRKTEYPGKTKAGWVPAGVMLVSMDIPTLASRPCARQNVKSYNTIAAEILTGVIYYTILLPDAMNSSVLSEEQRDAVKMNIPDEMAKSKTSPERI